MSLHQRGVRRHTRRSLRTAGGLVGVLLFFGLGLIFLQACAIDLLEADNLSISLGPAETVLGPDERTDNPFHTLGKAPDITAYVAHVDSYGFTARNLEELEPLPAPVLERGEKGAFDSCGAWLNSTWREGSLVRGWYHAETDCANRPIVRKSVAYAESYDGGRTFVKPDYPRNQVITAPPRYQDPNEASEGAHHIIRVDDYFYMYFEATRDRQIHLARSRVADGGRPGTWFKYYNGRFSEPGIGGESSPIAPGLLARSWVSYNSALDAFIGFSRLDPDFGFGQGFGLAISRDGLTNWKKVSVPVLVSESKWGDRDSSSKELIGYPSFIGLNGNANNISTDFWLYYMQIKPGQSFLDRYLVRRQVHVAQSNSSHPLDIAPRIALSRYLSADSNDTWTTTTNPPPEYEFVETLGYLFTTKTSPHMRPVYDCYLVREGDHFPDTREDCSAHGDRDVRNLRQMGWILAGPFPVSRQLFRCFDPETLDHFVSADDKCEGKQRESSIGYLRRSAEP
jgi:hypothetical protein